MPHRKEVCRLIQNAVSLMILGDRGAEQARAGAKISTGLLGARLENGDASLRVRHKAHVKFLI